MEVLRRESIPSFTIRSMDFDKFIPSAPNYLTMNYPILKLPTPLWIICLLIFSLPLSHGQNPPVGTKSIIQFEQIIKNQSGVNTIGINDLSNVQIKIYWMHHDRRASRVFLNRIKDYVGAHHASIVYMWDWPDNVVNTDNEVPIIVFDENWPLPPWWSQYNGMKIMIGEGKNNVVPALKLPRPESDILDLAAQYLMEGIEVNSSGKVISGSRLAYLSAAYFGLDEAFLTHQLDSILQMGLDSSAYPGASVSIAYKGSVIYNKAVGYHTSDKKYLVRTHDMFDLASVTKITAGVTTLMFLYEDGKLDLNKTLGDYFPYFNNSDKAELGLKRILTHSAGLTPYLVYYNLAKKPNGKYQRNTLASRSHGSFNYAVTDSIFVSDRFSNFIYKSIKETSLKPGNKYEYSGLFFLLIPDLVNNLTGIQLDRYLYDRLFHPLGAHHTAFNPAGSYPIHQIIPTEVDQVWRKQLVHGGVHDEAAAVLQGLSTNAGLFSSAQDLIRLGETWRRKGQFGGQQFWSPETIETFTRCYYCDEGNRRGLGFDRPPLPEHDYLSYMSPLASHESFGHSGFTGTMMWVDPAEEYTFVFLSNRVHPSRENTKLYSLNIRPDLHGVLYKTLEKSRRP